MSITVAYETEATATGGGRNGVSKLASGMLTVTMTSPKELGGSGLGHNPEEMFALGYAACYLGAMRFAAGSENSDPFPRPRQSRQKSELAGAAKADLALRRH